MTRRGILAAALLLLPLAAQAQPAPAAPPRRRRRATARALPPPPPPAPAPLRGDPAPVPDRDMEGPRRAERAAAARVNPALIDPNAPRVGATADLYGPPAREDRLLRQPGAGARLSVPFGY